MTNSVIAVPVLLISSCDQVCNVSQFASILEGKLRIQVMNEMMMQSKTLKGTVFIYFMVIKKNESTDVTLVNICFRTLFISLLMFVFVLKEK